MGTVIAIVSGKGGTGKTSVCAGLSACLAAEKYAVLAVDCDVAMRNLDISLAMSDLAATPFTAMMEDDADWNWIPKHPDIPNLAFLTAPVTCRSEDLNVEKFKKMVEKARESFDYCFLDAPAGIGAGFRLAVQFADLVLVVTTPDPTAMRDSLRASQEVEALGNIPMKLVVNRASRWYFGSTKTCVDDVMDQVALPLLGIIPADKSVPLAAAKGKPLVLATTKGAATACLRMARRLGGQSVPMTKRI